MHAKLPKQKPNRQTQSLTRSQPNFELHLSPQSFLPHSVSLPNPLRERMFGASSSSFGTPSSTPAFGTSTSSFFGTPSSTPAFGTPSSTPAFGTPSSTPAFGTPSSSPAFGAPSTPAFGTPSTSLFGSSLFGSSPSPFGQNQQQTTPFQQPSTGFGFQTTPFGTQQQQQQMTPFAGVQQLTTQMAPVAPLPFSLAERDIQVFNYCILISETLIFRVLLQLQLHAFNVDFDWIFGNLGDC